MKKTKFVGLLALFVIGILVSVTSVLAYDSNSNSKEGCDNKFADIASYSELEAAMQGKGMLRFINEDNFDTFVLMHKALSEGNEVLAFELRSELGLGQKAASQNGEGFGERNMQQKQQHKRLN